MTPRGARASRLVLFLTAALALAFASVAPAAEKKRRFDLPAGEAVTALKQFSEQSGEQIVYPIAQVRRVRTNAVRGELTPREALERMLAGTELRVVQDA